MSVVTCKNTAIINRFQAGDADAYPELLNANKGFLHLYAQRYYSLCVRRNDIDIEDLLQLGSIALYRAAQKYDPNRGAKFISYAGFYIRTEYSRAFRLHRLSNVLCLLTSRSIVMVI